MYIRREINYHKTEKQKEFLFYKANGYDEMFYTSH